MRAFILGLLLLLSSCEVDQPVIGGTYAYEDNVPHNIINLTEAIRREYAPNAAIYILYNQPLSYGVLGIANKVGPHSYLIQFAGHNPDPTATIFHEMGHIIDSEQGRLIFKVPVRWEGKECDFSIPWHERPWEISANEWRDCLIYEYQNHQLEHYDYALEDWLENYKINLIWLK